MRPLRYIDIPAEGFAVTPGSGHPLFPISADWDEDIVSVETIVPPTGNPFFRIWLAKNLQ